MPEMSKLYTPKFKGDKNPREKILALGQKITDRIGHKVTVDDPEYWGLAPIVTDEMADICLKMKLRTPYTIEQMVKMTGVEKEKLEPLLQEMGVIGIIEYNWENKDRVKQYVLPMFVPGSAEFSNMNKEQMDKHPEIVQFFERMSFLPLEKITPMVPPGGAGIGMHVIPVEKAISTEQKSLSIEHISHWLDKYEGKYALSLCSCRYGAQVLHEGCGDDPEDWCIAIGDMADYCVQTNKGHYVTKERVFEVLKQAEDNGYVHQITNIDGEDKIFAICNCNVNVCHALRTSQLFNTPNMSRSAYTAKVDPKNCVACGRCVEYCPAGAVKLGQKLCTVNGAIKYPKHELPDRLSWGKDKWDEDYVNNNRINSYDTGTAPCKSACPAHIAVQGYLKLANQGKYKEALALIKRENPLPAVCGRICGKFCEDECTRGQIDQAVAIDAVKKFIAEQDLNAEHRYVPQIVVPSLQGRFKQKIAIIGAGPAGLSCAFYLAEKGYYPTIFEKNNAAGGMLTYGVPSYKLEKDVINAEIDIIKEMGVEIKLGVNVGEDITIDELKKEGYKAFYIAIGCQEGRLPNIPNQDALGCETAINFLHRVTDDKSIKLDGEVVVVGGGNVAIDAARSAIRLGASKVTICSLEKENELPADPLEIKEAKEEGINFVHEVGPKEILANDNKVNSIVFKKCLSVFDEEHNFSPKYDENDLVTLKADYVIYSIGQKVKYGKLLETSQVTFNKYDYPIADPITYQTNDRDIFVGGDLYTGPSNCINAIAQGKEGAFSIHRYVQVNGDLVKGRDKRYFPPLNKTELIFGKYDLAQRHEAGMDESIDYKRSFKDAHLTLTEEEVKSETNRCLSCGASIVDENKCIGCGVCTTKCEFDAIHLFRDHPECSKMIKSEKKMGAILPYMLKRAVKIKFGKKTEEEKESQRKHKEWVEAQKTLKDQ